MEIIKRYKYILIVIIMLVFGISIVFSSEKRDEEEIVSIKEEESNNEIKENYYYVDIKGFVNNPNVYKISSNSRIIDVIDMAGGLNSDADTSVLNLSKKVFDEMTIIIYSKTQIEEAKKRIIDKEPTIVEIIKEVEKECLCPGGTNNACINESNGGEQNSDKININNASKDLLMTLPGIGESKANDIINYRKDTKFLKIEDIKNVNGIGDSTFEKLKELITV